MIGRLNPIRYLMLLAVVLVLEPGPSYSQIESGRIYVRRIEFQGITSVRDTVLRREMLIVEGSYLDTVAMEQSRLRLEQLPYIARVQVGLVRIDGAPDQVDVVFDITSAPARRYGGGGAYSKSQRASLNGFFINENIFGTGQQFSARIEVGDFRRVSELSHTDPYARANGVSRTITLSSREVDRLTAGATAFDASLANAAVEYGYRTGENHAIRFGLALHDVDLTSGSLASDQFLHWIGNNGTSTSRGAIASTGYRVPEFLLRWREDSRNRVVLPDRGRNQSLTFRTAVPGSDIEYYAIDYELNHYWPLDGRWTASFRTKFNYGVSFSAKTTALPPYLNWFAGGPKSVRAYHEDRLGPRDSLGNAYGGNFFVAGQFELMMPWPEKWRERMRIGFFYDVGNTFSTENVSFRDDASQNLDYGFEFSRLRQSAGIAAQVLIPIGVLRLSYGMPLNGEDDHPNRFLRDDIDRFQISIGVEF